MKTLTIAVLAVLLAGCVTTTSPFGYRSGLGGGGRTVQYMDPERPVHPGRIAHEGINGQSGPYAAALGIGTIENPAARQDAKEALIAVSENAWGGNGTSGLASRQGRIRNSYSFPITVVIRGVRSWNIPANGNIITDLPGRSKSYLAEIFDPRQPARPFASETIAFYDNNAKVEDGQVLWFDSFLDGC